MTLARIVFSDEFERATRFRAGQALMKLGYNLDVLRKKVEAEAKDAPG